jgi:tetratricopeptide (TPR) repeat protein
LQVLDEQQLGAGGVLDQNQAAQLGQVLGVQALVVGNVGYTYKDNDFQEERTYTKDKKKYTTYVRCRKRAVTTTVRVRIISAESGQILGSKEASRALDKKECEENIANLPPVAQMVEDCLKHLSFEIVNYFAPQYLLSEYELEKIEVKQFKDLGETAAKKAEDLEVDDAYIIYKSIYDQDPYNPKLLYNMGVLNEVVGNYRKAIEFYGMALQLKEEKDYKKAFARVEKNLEFTEALRALGIEIAEHSFVASEADKAAALAQKVEIKGGSGDRIPVFAEPRESSEVVGQVPGGITFTVISQEGEWYRIKLLGGKEGYVHQDKAKMK